MQNYNQQQQAVILKGIAQQLIGMNIPTFPEAIKLFNHFGIHLEQDSLYPLVKEGIDAGFIRLSGTWISINGLKIGRFEGNTIEWSANGKKLLFQALADNEVEI